MKLRWPWKSTSSPGVDDAIKKYDEVREPERKRIERRLKTVEAEVAAMRDAIEAEIQPRTVDR